MPTTTPTLAERAAAAQAEANQLRAEADRIDAAGRAAADEGSRRYTLPPGRNRGCRRISRAQRRSDEQGEPGRDGRPDRLEPVVQIVGRNARLRRAGRRTQRSLIDARLARPAPKNSGTAPTRCRRPAPRSTNCTHHATAGHSPALLTGCSPSAPTASAHNIGPNSKPRPMTRSRPPSSPPAPPRPRATDGEDFAAGSRWRSPGENRWPGSAPGFDSGLPLPARPAHQQPKDNRQE